MIKVISDNAMKGCALVLLADNSGLVINLTPMKPCFNLSRNSSSAIHKLEAKWWGEVSNVTGVLS